jgi:hypothetical protein
MWKSKAFDVIDAWFDAYPVLSIVIFCLLLILTSPLLIVATGYSYFLKYVLRSK